MASRTASEIWSAILSGCPSETDSDVKRCLAMSFFTFKSKPLSSVSVNRYRRINIWTAILGHLLVSVPVVFRVSSSSHLNIGHFFFYRRSLVVIFILLFQ
ncbi:DUF2684 family protein [Pectobacterium parmentieri]|nr:DUF2684 family protein [Pectobacterium parmentieri]MCL6384428.1 DUF2684 family protein [Pectobacterium parmentieri]PWD57958.1 hypothetical protein DF211_20295 [Pectobacterium parmentieri]